MNIIPIFYIIIELSHLLEKSMKRLKTGSKEKKAHEREKAALKDSFFLCLLRIPVNDGNSLHNVD